MKLVLVARMVSRLPEIWDLASDKQGKSLLRCLVEKVVLDRGEHDIATVRIVWRRGACSMLKMKMRVSAIADLTNGSCMRERVGRTVTLKIKYADFQQITRSQSLPRTIEERAALERVSIDLLRAQFPVTKGIRLLGISIAALGQTGTLSKDQLPLGI